MRTKKIVPVLTFVCSCGCKKRVEVFDMEDGQMEMSQVVLSSKNVTKLKDFLNDTKK